MVLFQLNIKGAGLRGVEIDSIALWSKLNFCLITVKSKYNETTCLTNLLLTTMHYFLLIYCNLQVSINGLDVTKINFSVIISNLSFLQLRFSSLTYEIPD